MEWLQALLILVLPLTLLLVIGLLPGNSDERLARIVGVLVLSLGIVLPLAGRDIKTDVTSFILIVAGLAASLFGWRPVWRWFGDRWQRRWEAVSRQVRVDSCLLDAEPVDFVAYSAEVPRSSGRLRVVRGPWRHGPRGGQRPLGDLEWGGYSVLANGEDFARAMLDDRLRGLVVRADVLGGNAFEVALRPGLLHIRATFRGAGPRRRVSFVEAVRALAGEVQERLMRDLVHLGPVEAAPAVCEICGDAVGEPAAVCVKCATPHHRECWAYNGRCSIYGCGETRSR